MTRSITVKQGTNFFFPLITYEADNIGCRPSLAMTVGGCFNGTVPPPQNWGFSQLQAEAKSAIDPVTGLSATLATCSDATCNTLGPASNVRYGRLQSPPFGYTLPPAPDNLQVIVDGKVAPVAADGYYAFLQGNLSPGFYKLEYRGQVPFSPGPGSFIQDITYLITVIP